MIFKRPKTTNNFGFCASISKIFFELLEDDKTHTEHKEEDYDVEWQDSFENQIVFWYIMQITEYYDSKDKEGFNLSYICEVVDYQKSVKDSDEYLWDENELGRDNWEGEPTKDAYSMAMYRISELTALFFAFDIKKIWLDGYPDEIGIQVIRSYFHKWKENGINDDDFYELYYACAELGGIDAIKEYRRLYQNMNPTEWKENRVFTSEIDEKEIYPGGYNTGFWRFISLLGGFIKIDFDFDKENMQMLIKLLDAYISETFDEVYGIEDITRKFITIAKKSEIIGNTVFIKFSDAINADFPCLQYIYWLNKTDGAMIDSWKIKDAFMVKLFDPTICHILGISSDNPKHQADILKLSYNEKKEALEFNEKKLGLGPNNEAFIKEYFDLMFDFDGGVSIDEIVERLEPNIYELGPEKILKKKKSLSYDRVNLLNKKIARLSGITGLFRIENGYIKLSSEIRVENESKTIER